MLTGTNADWPERTLFSLQGGASRNPIAELMQLVTDLYDVRTGKQLWQSANTLGGWQDGIPTAADGRVFIGANNALVARDAETGKDLWTYRSPGTSNIPGNATPASAAVVDGTVTFEDEDGRDISAHRAGLDEARQMVGERHKAAHRLVGQGVPQTVEGHVVAQLLSHCVTNPACSPWEIISTKADTMQTMMAESNALKRMGAKRAGIRMLFSWKLINGLKSVLVVINQKNVSPALLHRARHQTLHG